MSVLSTVQDLSYGMRLIAAHFVGAAFFSVVSQANALAVQVNPIPVQESQTWFASEDTVFKLDGDTNQITTVLPLHETKALAVDSKDGSLRILTEKRILKFSSDGVNLWDKSLAGLGLEEGKHLALVSYDSSLWVASGNRLIHLDSDGLKLGEINVPDQLQLVTIALDESLWIIGGRRIWHYAPSGTLLGSHPLSNVIKGQATHMVVDSLGNRLWISSKGQLMQFKLNNLAKPALTVALPTQLDELTIDPLTGTLWGASKARLLAYASNGTAMWDIGLASLGVDKPASIAYDPQKKSLWLGYKDGVARISPEGNLLFNGPLNKKTKAIGVPSFFITPKLTLEQPSDAAIIENARPTISVRLDASCFDVPCGFAPSRYGNHEVIAYLNGQPVGNLFHIEAGTGQASYAPSNALPEGRNTLSAQARDRFGHVSNLIDSSFTVDSRALKILDVSPVDGSVLIGSQVMVSGAFRGPANTGITVNGEIAAISDDKFYANVPLQPDSNTITIAATTPDGLTVTHSLSVINSRLGSARVSAVPSEGVAPLKVIFSVEGTNEKTVHYINADFDGDGSVDRGEAAPNLNMEYGYTAPGTYIARFEIVDTQGNIDLTEVPVVVKDPAEIDMQLQSIWDGMNGALVAQNKLQALAYLNRSARLKYEPVFNALLPHFQSIVASYSALQNVSVTSLTGEYAINRVIDGVNQIFFIYFLRDPDGVWRLDSM